MTAADRTVPLIAKQLEIFIPVLVIVFDRGGNPLLEPAREFIYIPDTNN